MPRKPLTSCTAPGCGALTEGGRCPRHRREAEQARGTAAQRGYDSRWRRESREFLRLNPVCECGDPATHTDHRIPHKGDQRLFWDRSNWQPLCTRCHSRKTATTDGGFGRPAPRG